jgi:hypothetical protein
MNLVILLPRFLISEQIKRVAKFLHDFQAAENNDGQDIIRNLLWNQIFQTKIYYFTQTVMKTISLCYLTGVLLLIVDSAEHGLMKACYDDKGLKKICVLVIVTCFLKFFMMKKKMNEPGALENMKVIRIGKEASQKAKKEEKVCSICLQDFEPNQEVNLMKCNHIFHKGCIDEWFRIKRKCPLCNNF